MKKTNKAKIYAVTLSLIIILALSATAFAEGPKGSPQMDRMQSGQQMNAPQDGMQMNGPQGNMQMDVPQGDMQMNGPQTGFPSDRQPGDFSQGMPNGAPQGSFGENGGQQPPEKPEGEEPPLDGQQPPEKPEGEEGRTPPSDSENGFGPNGQMPRGGRDPMSQIFSAVNELEDEEVKASIESLMQAHRDAMDAERNAEDDDARAAAAEATAAARDALNEALTAAGLELSMEAPEELPPEKPEGEEPPADGQQPPEKPEDGEGQSLPSNSQQPPEVPEGAAQAAGQQLSEDDQDLFQLFRQFLEWLKGYNEK